jgi:hypothetical protein
MHLFFLWSSLLTTPQQERSLNYSNSTRFKKRSSIPLTSKDLEEKLPEDSIILPYKNFPACYTVLMLLKIKGAKHEVIISGDSEGYPGGCTVEALLTY